MWAVGQAMALERSLSLFSSPARGTEGIFPEFYFFDCTAAIARFPTSQLPADRGRQSVPADPVGHAALQ
jgi:hypothetical protein